MGNRPEPPASLTPVSADEGLPAQNMDEIWIVFCAQLIRNGVLGTLSNEFKKEGNDKSFLVSWTLFLATSQLISYT
jgi:hypothetical protein